jgi:hypothetical protein
MEPLQPQPAWAPLTPAQIARYDENGFCTMPAVLDAEAVAAVTRACDRHMEEWGPKTQPDFPINFYANRYTPLLSDPALQALPSHPAVLTAAVQLLRSVVRACRASRPASSGCPLSRTQTDTSRREPTPTSLCELTDGADAVDRLLAHAGNQAVAGAAHLQVSAGSSSNASLPGWRRQLLPQLAPRSQQLRYTDTRTSYHIIPS